MSQKREIIIILRNISDSKWSIAWDEGRLFFDLSAAVEEVAEPGVIDPDLVPEMQEFPDEPIDSVDVDVLGLYRDCLFVTDHLGNVRTVIDITTDQVSPSIMEQNNYLPFGSRLPLTDPAYDFGNRWRYAAKEEQRFGPADLGLLDFGARMYDPFTARWTAVDPKAGPQVSSSPFTYCVGNPVRLFDSTGLIWEDSNGNIITDHSNIKVYIFFDPKAFSSQSIQMYKDAVEKYGEGSVAMSKAITEEDFIQDWKDMSSNDIREVNLNYHGSYQTINLDYSNNQYLSSTVSGDTPKGSPATRIEDLPTPSGNVQNAQLNINSCQSNNISKVKDGGLTVAQSFLKHTYFRSIRTTDKGVSYWYWTSPNRPHPRDDSSWQYLFRQTSKRYFGKGLPQK